MKRPFVQKQTKKVDPLGLGDRVSIFDRLRIDSPLNGAVGTIVQDNAANASIHGPRVVTVEFNPPHKVNIFGSEQLFRTMQVHTRILKRY
jgi:hypothetical protein